MTRRLVVVVMVVVAFAASACARGSHGERVSAPVESTRSAGAGAVTVAWSVAVDGEPAAVAADARGVVATVDHEGVVALNGRGRVLWAVPLDGASIGSPVLTADRVIVPTSRVDGSGGCVGLDRETGARRWTYEAIGTGGVAVARAGAFVICVMRDGRTAGIAPELGFAHWEFTFAADVDPSSVEVPGRTVPAVDENAGLFAFAVRYGGQWAVAVRDVDTGRHRRLLDLGTAGPPSAPVVVGPGELAVAASDPSELCIVDVHSLRATRIAMPATQGFDPASVPLVVERLVIVAARAGEVTAIDLDRRRGRWIARTADPILAAHPVLVGAAVMLGTRTGRLVAFRLANGAPVRLPPAPGRVIATAADSGAAGVQSAGVEVVGRDADAGRIERWELGSGP